MYPQTAPILSLDIIEVHNPLTIAIADTSFYPTNFTIVSPTLQITPPGFPVVTAAYIPNSITTFNSNTLNITCVDDVNYLTPLPDGIWTVSMSISPSITYTLQKQFIRTLAIQQLLGEAFLATDITECNMDMKSEQMKIIDQADYLIQASIAAANQCNTQLAMNLYQIAYKMLSNLLKGNCSLSYNPTLISPYS